MIKYGGGRQFLPLKYTYIIPEDISFGIWSLKEEQLLKCLVNLKTTLRLQCGSVSVTNLAIRVLVCNDTVPKNGKMMQVSLLEAVATTFLGW